MPSNAGSGVGVSEIDAKPRHTQASLAKYFAHAEFAAAGFDGSRMVVENTAAARDVGRCNGGTVAECENSIDVLAAHRFQNRIGCRVWRLEMDGDSAIAPRIVELVAAIRDKNKVDSKLASRFVEAARLVAEFCGEDEESRHFY